MDRGNLFIEYEYERDPNSNRKERKREKTMSKGFCPSIQSYFVHIEGRESIVRRGQGNLQEKKPYENRSKLAY